MKKIFMFMAVFALALSFSGCSILETDTESMMHPPLLSIEQEKLNDALKKVAGENYTLKYPKNGETNSAFIFRDLDNDGTDEAVAFYSSVDESTRINVLKNENNDWVSVYEAAGFSGEIESVEFVKIDEKSPAMVIGWEGEIGVYRFGKNRIETLHTASCDGGVILDINEDGFMDIAFFNGEAIDRSFFTVLYRGENGIVLTDEIIVNAKFDSLLSMKTGKIDEGTTALFIDSIIYDGVYLTEVVTLDDGKAVRYTLADFVKYEDEEEEENEVSSGTIIVVGSNLGKRGIFLRNTEVSCTDIDGDGIMEMPVEIREDYANKKTDKIYYLQYVNLVQTEQEIEESLHISEKEALSVWSGIANPAGGYLFELPEIWSKDAKVSIDSASSEMLFVDKDTGEVLLKICAADKNDYQDKYEDYILVAENATKNYYVKTFMEPENKFYIDPETFEECFNFI